MSRAKRQTKENIEFIARFIEVCGTSKPAEVKRLLNVSYQTAKNYLNGRIPQSDILIVIADRTSFSIDWLLTGRGKKFFDGRLNQDTPIPAGQMEAFVRSICVEVINEVSGRHEATQPKIVVLQSSELMSEKVTDDCIAFAGRER